MRLPPTKLIAIDVDGVLNAYSKVNAKVVEVIRDRHRQGFEIVVWSARGTAYAKEWAERAGVAELCAAIIGKPGYILDDQGWAWTRFTIPLEVPY